MRRKWFHLDPIEVDGRPVVGELWVGEAYDAGHMGRGAVRESVEAGSATEVGRSASSRASSGTGRE